jgi:hypothetical protein
VLGALGHVRGYQEAPKKVAKAPGPDANAAAMEVQTERPSARQASLPANQPGNPAPTPAPPAKQAGLTFNDLMRIADLKAADQANPQRPGLNEPDFFQLLDQATGNVIQLFTKQIGSLRSVARSLGVSRRMLIDYVLLRPHLQAIFGDRRENLIDDAETMLHELVKQKKRWAIRLVLRMLRKARGFARIGDPDSFRLTREELNCLDRIHSIVYGNEGDKQRTEDRGQRTED